MITARIRSAAKGDAAMTTYRDAIATALSVHRGYRELAASDHYLPSPRPCATVEAAAYWYGTDDRAYAYDEATGGYYATDARTYRALAVLLRIAPVGGRTYLGVPLRTVAAASVVLAAAGVALSLALPSPSCDDGERCATAAEYAETVARLEAIRETRTGGRFDAYEACAAMLAADDWDATGCVGDYPDLDARSRVLWGPDGDPETGADR